MDISLLPPSSLPSFLPASLLPICLSPPRLSSSSCHHKAAVEWYKKLILYLKSHLGNGFVDDLATSTRHNTYSDITRGVGGVEPADPGAYSNRWTNICKETAFSVDGK